MTERGLEAAIRQGRDDADVKVPGTVTSLRRHARLSPFDRPLSTEAVRFLAEFFSDDLGDAVVESRLRLEQADAARSAPRDRSGRVVGLERVRIAVYDCLSHDRPTHVRWAGVTQRFAFASVVDALSAIDRRPHVGPEPLIELSMLKPDCERTLDVPSRDMRKELRRSSNAILAAVRERSLAAQLILRHYDYQPPMHGALINEDTLFLAGSLPTFRNHPLRYHLHRSGSQEFDEWKEFFLRWFELSEVVSG